MIRVLHIANTAFFVEKLLMNKLCALSAAGYEIHAACPRAGEIRAPFALHEIRLARSISPFKDFLSTISLIKLMRKGRFDIVHTHSAKAGFIGRVAARVCGVKTVLHTAHGLPFYENQGALSHAAYKWLERLAARASTAIFSQNMQDMSTMLKLGFVKPGRVLCEGNGVDLDSLSAAPSARDAKRAELGLRKDDVAIALFARFEPVKGHEWFLDAFEAAAQNNKRLVLLLAGANLGRCKGFAKRLLERIERSPVRSSIKLLGFRKDVPELLAAADILALPSQKEGIPRVVMEGMALCLPVVASDVPGTRELVVSGVTGELAPFGDRNAMTSALISLAKDAKLRQTLGQNGRRRVSERFDERQVIARLLIAYESITDY